MRYGIVYRAISPTNKVYVGQTVQRFRYRKSRHYQNAGSVDSPLYYTKFCCALRKYGESFQWQVLERAPVSKLHLREQYYIKLFDSYRSGYNMTEGGVTSPRLGVKHSAQTKKVISEGHKKKYREGWSPRRGKKHSTIALKKMSGEKSSSSKLTWDKVARIREMYGNKSISQQKIAEIFGVARTTVQAVVEHRSWVVK